MTNFLCLSTGAEDFDNVQPGLNGMYLLIDLLTKPLKLFYSL